MDGLRENAAVGGKYRSEKWKMKKQKESNLKEKRMTEKNRETFDGWWKRHSTWQLCNLAAQSLILLKPNMDNHILKSKNTLKWKKDINKNELSHWFEVFFEEAALVVALIKAAMYHHT